MSETVMALAPKPKRKIKETVPPKLQAEVERASKVIRKHADVLGPLGMQAIQVATLQVVAGKLDELRRLLAANGFTQVLSPVPQAAGSPPSIQAPPPSPKVENPCVMCGRPGTYRMKYGAHGWYCAGGHEKWAREQDGEEQLSRAISPSTTTTGPAPAPPPTGPTQPPPGLANALKALQGGSDAKSNAAQ